MTTLLSHGFADAIQSNAFLYTAHKEKMTDIGWIYLGTDWNTMQTYAGLSEEFRQPVMEGMVGVSPFVGSMDPFVEAFNGWERFVSLSEQSSRAAGEHEGAVRVAYSDSM